MLNQRTTGEFSPDSEEYSMAVTLMLSREESARFLLCSTTGSANAKPNFSWGKMMKNPVLRFSLRGIGFFVFVLALFFGMTRNHVEFLETQQSVFDKMGLPLPLKQQIPNPPGFITIPLMREYVAPGESVGFGAATLVPPPFWLKPFLPWLTDAPQVLVAELQLNDLSVDDSTVQSLTRLESLQSLILHKSSVTERGVENLLKKRRLEFVLLGSENVMLNEEFAAKTNKHSFQSEYKRLEPKKITSLFDL